MITQTAGGITITGKEDIALYRLMTIQSAVGLEAVGLKHSRGSVTAMAKREFGLKGNTLKVYDALTRMVAEKAVQRTLAPDMDPKDPLFVAAVEGEIARINAKSGPYTESGKRLRELRGK